jgi:hypothetical protein
MRRSTCLASAVALLCALMTVTAAPAAPAANAKSHRAALEQFQRDLVSVLALRVEARPLLGAALLARPLHDMPDMLGYHELLRRAAAAPDAGAAVAWAQLADCDAKAQTCPNADAVARLEQLAPDNAAVWLLALGQDARKDDRDAAREALAKAAAASAYDDYLGVSLQALAYAVATLPPPPDTLATVGPLASSPDGVQAMIVFGVGSAQPLPGFQLAARMCDEGKDDDALRADCLKLARTLEWGSGALARSLGLHLRETLSDDPAQQADAQRARRSLVWQVQSFTELTARAQGDPAVARRLLALARNGGTEMSLMLAALRAFDIPTEPAADWQPGHAD